MKKFIVDMLAAAALVFLAYVLFSDPVPVEIRQQAAVRATVKSSPVQVCECNGNCKCIPGLCDCGKCDCKENGCDAPVKPAAKPWQYEHGYAIAVDRGLRLVVLLDDQQCGEGVDYGDAIVVRLPEDPAKRQYYETWGTGSAMILEPRDGGMFPVQTKQTKQAGGG